MWRMLYQEYHNVSKFHSSFSNVFNELWKINHTESQMLWFSCNKNSTLQPTHALSSHPYGTIQLFLRPTHPSDILLFLALAGFNQGGAE
jgi:hypothetical protein